MSTLSNKLPSVRPLEQPTDRTCCRKVRQQYGHIQLGTKICGKPATHINTNGVSAYCRHHSGTGRFVVRNGDVGEILARFDTEKELRDNIGNYPGMRMQKVTKSHRRDIY